MNDWCIDHATGAFDAARAQAMIDAYHAVRPLTDDEHTCWRTVLRAAALRFWISRLDDFHRPRPGGTAHAARPGALRAHPHAAHERRRAALGVGMIVKPQGQVTHVRTLPASAGWTWLREALALYWRQPFAFTALVILYTMAADAGGQRAGARPAHRGRCSCPSAPSG